MTALVRLLTLPGPTGGGLAPAVSRGLEALSRAHSLDVSGTEDFTTFAPEWEAAWTDPDHRLACVVAVADPAGAGIDTFWDRVPGEAGDPAWEIGEVAAPWGPSDALVGADAVVGRALVRAGLVDNPRRAELDVSVHPGWRDSGLPELLLWTGEAVARSWGRTVLQAWTDSPGWAAPGTTEAVPGITSPVPGDGGTAAPTRTPMTELLGRAGFRPVHTEWVTSLDVAAASAHRPVPVPGYEVVTWSSPRTPEHLLAQVARLRGLASTDMPSGGLDVEPEDWDPARVLRAEAVEEASGTPWVATAVRPVGGELVGWTQIIVLPWIPAVAHQSDTLVRAGHRRQGLASWIKRVNLSELHSLHPRVERVHTWTDGTNAPVIAMNTRLGFRPTYMEVAWQKEVGPLGSGVGGARP